MLRALKSHIVTAVAAIALWQGLARDSAVSAMPMVELLNTPHVVLKVPEAGLGLGQLNIATIAPYSDKEFFVANFENVFLLNIEKESIEEVIIGNESVEQVRRIGYQPTGLFYDSAAHRLIVANYLKNNLMIFDVAKGTHTLRLLETVQHEALISPESVWFDHQSRILVSANFDGHNVSAFRIEPHAPAQFLWQSSLPLAHGIAIDGGKVYATGLEERILVELELETGRRLRQTGILGWRATENEFLWPTSVYPDKRGNLIISDADTGLISVLEMDSFMVRQVVGGNGPGKAFLNQPYFTAIVEDKFIAISTKQQRFIYGRYPDFRPTKAFTRYGTFWAHFSPVDPGAALGFWGWDEYWWNTGPHVSLLNCGYLIYKDMLKPDRSSRWLNRIKKAGGGATCPVIRLGYVATLLGMNMFKQLQMFTVDGWYVFLSPQSPDGPLFVRSIGNAIYAVRYPFGRNDCWIVRGDVQCPDGKRDVEQMVAQVNGLVEELRRARCQTGVLLHKRYINLLMEWYRNIGMDERHLSGAVIEASARDAFTSMKGISPEGTQSKAILDGVYSAWEQTTECGDTSRVMALTKLAERLQGNFSKMATIDQLALRSIVLGEGKDPSSMNTRG